MPRSAPGSSTAGHPGPRRDPHRPSVLPVPSPGTTSATLLLNATYEPLCVVSSRRAIVLVLAEKAEPVDSAADVVHAERVSLPVPVVVRLTRYVRVPYPASVPLSRRAVFTRDGQTCVYCGGSATSIDHVVPRSRGGTHTWENCVACCARCNHKKADKLLAELGWPLRTMPTAPRGRHWRLLAGLVDADPQWLPYLGETAA